MYGWGKWAVDQWPCKHVTSFKSGYNQCLHIFVINTRFRSKKWDNKKGQTSKEDIYFNIDIYV